MYKTNEIMQAAYIVDDLDAAITNWMKVTKAGPFLVVRDASPENFRYRGTPCETLIDLAIGQAGDIQVEFIQPKAPGPNIWRESVPAGVQAYHHQCYVTDDLEAEIARYKAMGIDVGIQADTGGVQFVYFDTRPLIGCMTEVVQRSEAFDGMCKMIADASIGWNGIDREIKVG